MTKEELRKEFDYEIMKYNGQVSAMFEWFHSKLEEKDEEIDMYKSLIEVDYIRRIQELEAKLKEKDDEIKLQKAYYNTLDETSQGIIASLEAKLKEKDEEIATHKLANSLLLDSDKEFFKKIINNEADLANKVYQLKAKLKAADEVIEHANCTSFSFLVALENYQSLK